MAGMRVYGKKKKKEKIKGFVSQPQVWFGVYDSQVVSAHFRAPSSLAFCLWLLFLLFVVMIRK